MKRIDQKVKKLLRLNEEIDKITSETADVLSSHFDITNMHFVYQQGDGLCLSFDGRNAPLFLLPEVSKLIEMDKRKAIELINEASTT